MGYFSAREARTSVPCPDCGHDLDIIRDCHEVKMRCPHCRRQFPLKDFIGRADGAMEEFLENVYCDRI